MQSHSFSGAFVYRQLGVVFLLSAAHNVTDPEGLGGLLRASASYTTMLIVHSSSALTLSECAAVVSYLWPGSSPKAPWKYSK